MQNNDISLMTFNRLEGLKKYYAMDYSSAIYHFSQLNNQEQSAVLYEHIDSYYCLDQFNSALEVLADYNNTDLTENIIYLKSKIYLKLNLYNNALSDLNYLIDFFPSSDYTNILQFEIEKINLLKR
jgi:outer membrane protein assembly factor BamD (BamD/ComL family)